MLDEFRLLRVVECIAAGLTVSETRGQLAWPLALDEMEEAKGEAVAQGIEEEDMAPSWREVRNGNRR